MLSGGGSTVRNRTNASEIDVRMDGPDVWYEWVASQRLVEEQRQQGAGALEQPSARCDVMRSHPVLSERYVDE